MKARRSGARGPAGGLRLVASAGLAAGAALLAWGLWLPPKSADPAPEPAFGSSPEVEPEDHGPTPADESPPSANVALAARVLDSLGRPVAGASAVVAGPGGRILARARTDSGGLLLLRPARQALGRDAVIVIADEGAVHWRPAPTESAWLDELVLSSEASILGQLLLPDGTPVSGVELRARLVALEGDASGIATAGMEAIAAEAEVRVAHTDPLGRFDLTGLTPGEHLLEARLGADESWARLWITSHPASLVSARERSQREVVSIDALLVEVVATDGGGLPLREGRVRVRGVGPDGSAFETGGPLDSARGQRTLLVPAAARLELEAQGAGGLRVASQVDLGDEPTGVVRVEMRALGLPGVARLLAVAIAPGGGALAASTSLWRLEDGGAQHPLEVAPDAEGWIGPLEPGRWRLRLEAVGDRDPRHPTLSLPFAPVELEFELRAGDARRLELPVWSGQRLVLTLEPPREGWEPRGAVEVLEPGGWRRLSFYDQSSAEREGLPQPGRPARSWTPIDPAATRLVVELEGREPIERELDLPLDGDLEVVVALD
ncbi:carboxypeptidase-like regulatory domain-containing protein [Planctomycetes bacterium Pla133]|uniref:Uncharacterized protein n=1 Tax=Engelhardtia mirabilis TaxID=2528011 RepID=A0A518BLT6_9BACT|nr:hypothetical protein Pla133_30310 [Planctomycetes bacterium Pla133]QDV02266.1 hypothetical protein Pla86_30300 [Planctomycetes bacterium Pla86]